MAVVIPTELGTERIPKLLRQYAVPAIIAMTASSLYNMCDSIFIGQGVGSLALAGLALTFPIMNLSAAVGTLVGVGAATLISVLLGQKNYDTANKVLGNSVVLNIITGILFAVLVIAFLDPILYFFGASENTITYAREYMFIILLGNVVTHLYFGLNAVVRVMGLPKKAMGATIFTVALNFVLDYLFIMVLKWGIQGAAIATVFSQFLAMIYVFGLVSDKSRVIHLQRGIYRLKKRIISQTFSIGMAPFLMNACSCVIVIVINKQLTTYGGDMAIGAYGIQNRLGFIAAMIVMGINQGMQPIAGYNYGAQKHDRVSKVLHISIFWASVVTTLFFIVTELFPRQLAEIFTDDEELLAHTIRGMRINFVAFAIIGFQMVTTNFFQSIGKAKKAIFLSLTRQAICLLPLLLILPPVMGVDGVWWSLPISDVIASILTLWMLLKQKQEFRKSILAQQETSENQPQTQS
ncbi:MAG: MATE family efflux transporter [Bacteroidales bacterium]|nr:MATE family efflux transporter [Bacteroidales bacterium]